MTMHKSRNVIILFLGTLVFGQGCSWLSSKPQQVDNRLIEVMQQSTDRVDNTVKRQNVPLKIHYEIKHKPMREQGLAIALEIKPSVDLAACAYAVKLSDGLKIVSPLEMINLGTLEAGKVYNEEVVVIPVSEGLHEVNLYVAAENSGQQSQIKSISIPISVGGFKKQQRNP